MTEKERDCVAAGYMDRVDFLYELGEAVGGNRIFSSVRDLKRNRKCFEECGIVEVEIRLKRIVSRGSIFSRKKIRKSAI